MVQRRTLCVLFLVCFVNFCSKVSATKRLKEFVFVLFSCIYLYMSCVHTHMWYMYMYIIVYITLRYILHVPVYMWYMYMWYAT